MKRKKEGYEAGEIHSQLYVSYLYLFQYEVRPQHPVDLGKYQTCMSESDSPGDINSNSFIRAS